MKIPVGDTNIHFFFNVNMNGITMFLNKIIWEVTKDITFSYSGSI